MPDTSTLALFMAAALALNLTPGPDMLYVIARSTGEGRAAGVASALGIAIGCIFHIAALALGLSALLTAVPAAYDAIRFAGAAYLVFLGIRALTTRSGLFAPARAEHVPHVGRVFRPAIQGAITNVLNPKVALFFLAFIPQFVTPDGWPPAAQIVFLGVLFNVSGTIVNLVVALAASRATGWLRSEGSGFSRGLQRMTGLVFIGLGLRLAFARQR